MPKRAQIRRSNGKTGASRAGGLHVLVVENHLDTRQGVIAFLKSLGHRASFAEDKAHALARADEEIFDLLLSDISLPDGNGWELMEALAARGRRPSHAIAMSGLGTVADRTRSRDVGFEVHLVKPFHPEELEQALQSVAKLPTLAKMDANPVAAPAPAAGGLRQRLHDGLCQHLAAAALLQGALTRQLETFSHAAGEGFPTRLKTAAADARQINKLIDEALEETLSLMRSV